jgi:hypothetical protein
VEWYDFGEPDSDEKLVDAIVGHECTGSRMSNVRFFMRWATGDCTWEPWKHVKNLEALDHYFELQGVTQWQDLPLVQHHGEPALVQAAETSLLATNQPLVPSGTRPTNPKIVWTIGPKAIKVREHVWDST